MNNRGEVTIGSVLMLAVVVIAALVLLQASFANIGTMTQTRDVTNQTIKFTPTTVLQGQAVSNVVVTNASNGVSVPATNYSITNYNIGSDGVLRSYLTNLSGVFGGQNVNVSYTYEPLGYDTNAGNRTIIGLIALFSALAIAVVAMTPSLRNGIFDFF